MWTVILILILFVGLMALLLKFDSKMPDGQNDLHDSNGNHIYYDREIIKFNNKRK